ncbi:hypothetical protein DL96DRAFT_1715934 [Flagelloscypha sp. PMI_526]|nr:hypothetical protein DL96DRAFT_1715934 [Flagelloscypha sp. PMI_526]
MYILTTHPTFISDDRLGCCNKEEPTHADVIRALIHTTHRAIEEHPARASALFVQLIEDIAYSIHHNGNLDCSGLKTFLQDSSVRIPSVLAILDCALQLENHLPSSELPQIPDDGFSTVLKGGLVNSLLAYQSLGALFQPAGNTWGLPCFTSLYPATSAKHPRAVEGYLKTLFTHFEDPYTDSDEFSFYHSDAETIPDPHLCQYVPALEVKMNADFIEPPLDSPENAIPFVLVSANKQPGPGPTGTQEERWQSASPALAMSCLVDPVLSEDAAVITSPMAVHAGWNGHNRTAHLRTLFPKGERPLRQYILADALALDEVDPPPEGCLVDVQSNHVEREVRKLYAAFYGAAKAQSTQIEGPVIIEAPPWGCGAFCGNIVVKATCMLIAAGLAMEASGKQIQLRLFLDEQRHDQGIFIETLVAKKQSVSQLWHFLTRKEAKSCTNYADIFVLP